MMSSGDYAPGSIGDSDTVGHLSHKKAGLPKPRKVPKGGMRPQGRAKIKVGRRSGRRK